MTHRDFWRTTPAELNETLAAWKRREERVWYRTAWLACYVIAPHTKRKVTPEKLLGKVKASGSVKVRPEPQD